MGFSFSCVPADIDEKAIGNRSTDEPKDLVLNVARAKAKAVLPSVQDKRGILLAGDQVVVFQGRILEKPRTPLECRQFMRAYAQAPCSTVGSVVLVDLATGASVEGVDVATIQWNRIPEDVIDVLIQEGDCLYCAGGLMIEHPLLQPFIAHVDGAIDSVMGLSKQLVTRLIEELGNLDTAR